MNTESVIVDTTFPKVSFDSVSVSSSAQKNVITVLRMTFSSCVTFGDLQKLLIGSRTTWTSL